MAQSGTRTLGAILDPHPTLDSTHSATLDAAPPHDQGFSFSAFASATLGHPPASTIAPAWGATAALHPSVARQSQVPVSFQGQPQGGYLPSGMAPGRTVSAVSAVIVPEDMGGQGRLLKLLGVRIQQGGAPLTEALLHLKECTAKVCRESGAETGQGAGLKWGWK